MSTLKLEQTISMAVGIILVVMMLVVAIIFATPVTVLRDWSIRTTSDTYHLNDTIVLQSSSTKLRDATGKVSRTIECDSGKDSVIGYNLNLSEAKRPAGTATSTYGLKIPSNIVDLPATCRVVIAVDYKVLLVRNIHDNAVSNDFKVFP